MKRNILGLSLAAALCAFIAPGTSSAQEYPEKPIVVVVPFGPGGSHDLHARGITGIMPEIIGQPMIVKLLPGGAGMKATGFVANAKPDGYTILFTHNGIDMILPQTREVPFNAQEDFTPIAKINETPSIMLVKADSPFQTFDDFIEFAKANPGEVNVGHSGVWGASYTAFQSLANATGIKVNHIPHKGGGPMLQATLAGRIDVGFGSAQSVPVLESGEVRALAVLGNDKVTSHPALEKIPTTKELGYPDIGFSMERIFMAPSGISEDRLAVLRKAFDELQENKSYQRFMKSIGMPTQYVGGEDYAKTRPAEFAKFKEVIEAMTQ